MSVVPTFQCRTCGRTVDRAAPEAASHRPFCSVRCQMVDLSAWFDESYRIASPLTPDPEGGSVYQPPDNPPDTTD